MSATQLFFSFGALCGSVQADRDGSPQGPRVSVIGPCGVEFRLTGDGSPQDPYGFGFGALWGSVQADGIWSPQALLGVLRFVTLWD